MQTVTLDLTLTDEIAALYAAASPEQIARISRILSAFLQAWFAEEAKADKQTVPNAP